MSDLHRTQKILDSLLPPATDVIKHVSPQGLPSVYLQLLDSVYGSVEDGDELLAKLWEHCKTRMRSLLTT